jgi:hypothetical protein
MRLPPVVELLVAVAGAIGAVVEQAAARIPEMLAQRGLGHLGGGAPMLAFALHRAGPGSRRQHCREQDGGDQEGVQERQGR